MYENYIYILYMCNILYVILISSSMLNKRILAVSIMCMLTI